MRAPYRCPAQRPCRARTSGAGDRSPRRLTVSTGWRAFQQTAQCFAQLCDLRIARDDIVAQASLLSLQFLFEVGFLVFEQAQAPDVRTVGRTDEVRQHVHVAVRAPHQIVGRAGVGHECPVSAGNVARAHGILPATADLGCGRAFAEAADRNAMAAIQRLVDLLREALAAFDRGHGEPMKLVIVESACSTPIRGSKKRAQLRGREAGAHDRAMQRRRELPDVRPPLHRLQTQHRNPLMGIALQGGDILYRNRPGEHYRRYRYIRKCITMATITNDAHRFRRARSLAGCAVRR